MSYMLKPGWLASYIEMGMGFGMLGMDYASPNWYWRYWTHSFKDNFDQLYQRTWGRPFPISTASGQFATFFVSKQRLLANPKVIYQRAMSLVDGSHPYDKLYNVPAEAFASSATNEFMTKLWRGRQMYKLEACLLEMSWHMLFGEQPRLDPVLAPLAFRSSRVFFARLSSKHFTCSHNPGTHIEDMTVVPPELHSLLSTAKSLSAEADSDELQNFLAAFMTTDEKDKHVSSSEVKGGHRISANARNGEELEHTVKAAVDKGSKLGEQISQKGEPDSKKGTIKATAVGLLPHTGNIAVIKV